MKKQLQGLMGWELECKFIIIIIQLPQKTALFAWRCLKAWQYGNMTSSCSILRKSSTKYNLNASVKSR